MNKAEIATVERLRREGKELSAIAQETGISINTIKSHCSRHGIPAPRLIRTCMFCHSEIVVDRIARATIDGSTALRVRLKPCILMTVGVGCSRSGNNRDCH